VRCASVQIEPTPSEIWEDFRSRPAGLKKTGHVLLEAGCMAACYSTDDGTVRLPFDPATSELIPEVWERWLAWDPLRMVPRHADALRSMKAIYIEPARVTSGTSTSVRKRSGVVRTPSWSCSTPRAAESSTGTRSG
jgi:hypothetical protein